MGFAEDLGEIIALAPGARQTLMFSATIPASIRALSRQYQRQPLDVTVTDDETPIEQVFFEVERTQKRAALEVLLHAYRPESVVIFCNTRDGVRMVTEALLDRGFSALALHGELEQREREEMLVCFANRSSNVLVATDVAARGLDIRELPMVINFELATDADTHVHRIGRTGRAGSPGCALSLCTPLEALRAETLAEQPSRPLRWQRVPVAPAGAVAAQAPFATLAVDAGRQDKLRPGDVLGALTGEVGLPGTAVGKIDVFATRTYVAIARAWLAQAVPGLRTSKIKGRTFRIRQIGP
jgi:ATP-independent RNA helicase DbpA